VKEGKIGEREKNNKLDVAYLAWGSCQRLREAEKEGERERKETESKGDRRHRHPSPLLLPSMQHQVQPPNRKLTISAAEGAPLFGVTEDAWRFALHVMRACVQARGVTTVKNRVGTAAVVADLHLQIPWLARAEGGWAARRIIYQFTQNKRFQSALAQAEAEADDDADREEEEEEANGEEEEADDDEEEEEEADEEAADEEDEEAAAEDSEEESEDDEEEEAEEEEEAAAAVDSEKESEDGEEEEAEEEAAVDSEEPLHNTRSRGGQRQPQPSARGRAAPVAAGGATGRRARNAPRHR